jgi:aminopeptidase
MDEDGLKAAGVNKSATHVDFMIGTADLSITGIKADGREIPVFRDGEWSAL